MRIGIVPANWRAAGGVFQHSLAFLDTLRHIDTRDAFVIFHTRGTDLPLVALRGSFETVESHLLEHGSVTAAALSWAVQAADRATAAHGARRAWQMLRRRVRRRRGVADWTGDPDVPARRSALWHRLVGRHRIDLMVYLDASETSFEAGIPYVTAIHDLLHVFHPELPEAFVHGSPAYYEYVHRNAVRYATLVLVDAQTGKEDLLRIYGPCGADDDRIRVLPLLPAPGLRQAAMETAEIRRRYVLPERYLFYPARFWAHKNHLRLFEALARLRSREARIPLVLVGFKDGETASPVEIAAEEMRKAARRLGIEDQVWFLGTVSDEEMAGLYRGAAALVMPTLGGPSNMPVVEAWHMGCPVVTSDMRGTRDQAGDAALLVDPLSAEAIADGVYRMWTDAVLRERLAARGRDRAASATPAHQAERLGAILDEAKGRRGFLPA